MTRLAVAVALLAAIPALAAGQQPDHIAAHGVVPFYAEADQHLGGAVSWRKHVGRNWGLHVEYYFSTTALTANRQKAHSDHLLWAGVTKSFGPLDERVPYIILGGAGLARHTLYEDATGASLAPGIGFGHRQWNRSRTWFIAPEARLLINAHVTFSVTFGFRL